MVANATRTQKQPATVKVFLLSEGSASEQPHRSANTKTMLQ